MKKLFLVAVVAVLLTFLVGCRADENTKCLKDRFSFSDPILQNLNFYIITDNETGVQYLYVRSYDKAAMARLEPAEEVNNE